MPAPIHIAIGESVDGVPILELAERLPPDEEDGLRAFAVVVEDDTQPEDAATYFGTIDLAILDDEVVEEYSVRDSFHLDSSIRERVMESFEEIDIKELAERGSESTSLIDREMEVSILKRLLRRRRSEIAEFMDISLNRYDNLRQNENRKVQEANGTVKLHLI